MSEPEETASTSPSKSSTAPVSKRENVLSWDDYFMSVAFLSSMRSKDPSTQVGACIVNPDKRIVGIGYNGFPKGCSDDELPWARDAEDELDTKYPIYVALFPCNECAKVIIQSGITEVVYMSDKYAQSNSMRASRRMFNMAKVTLRQHTPSEERVTIDFNAIQGQSST